MMRTGIVILIAQLLSECQYFYKVYMAAQFQLIECSLFCITPKVVCVCPKGEKYANVHSTNYSNTSAVAKGHIVLEG